MLADLGDGLGEVPVQVQIGDQGAEGQAPHAVQGQNRSQHRAQHIADVPQVSVDRHEDIRNFICVLGTLPQLLVDGPELLNILVLMAEHFDDLLPLHHLLDVGVDLAQAALLLDEICPGHAAQLGRRHQHDGHHAQGQDGQRDIQAHHADKGEHNGDRGVDQLRDALADELPEGVHIVGVDRHDVPVGRGVKIFDGQGLHFGEKLYPDFLQRPLADDCHEPVISIGAEQADQIHQGQREQGMGQRAEIRRLHANYGLDVHIHQIPHEQRPPEGGQGRSQDQRHHKAKLRLVLPEHDAQHTFQQGHQIFLVCLLTHGQSHLRLSSGLRKFPGKWHWISTGFRGCRTR